MPTWFVAGFEITFYYWHTVTWQPCAYNIIIIRQVIPKRKPVTLPSDNNHLHYFLPIIHIEEGVENCGKIECLCGGNLGNLCL